MCRRKLVPALVPHLRLFWCFPAPKVCRAWSPLLERLFLRYFLSVPPPPTYLSSRSQLSCHLPKEAHATPLRLERPPHSQGTFFASQLSFSCDYCAKSLTHHTSNSKRARTGVFSSTLYLQSRIKMPPT